MVKMLGVTDKVFTFSVMNFCYVSYKEHDFTFIIRENSRCLKIEMLKNSSGGVCWPELICEVVWLKDTELVWVLTETRLRWNWGCWKFMGL
jgi:hypothetical protein